ncbi:MAG TPA: FixH family protein, partial [Ignavibacteriaceae bacterium]
YEKDLKYQNQIDKLNRTAALEENVEIKFDGSAVEIIFPESFQNKRISGEVYFYRPSERKKDFKIPLTLTPDLKQIIPVTRIDKGFWRIKLNWNMEGKEYYNERAITIN